MSSFPKDLNLSQNKPLAVAAKPSINRYRSDNTSYSGGDIIRIEIPCGRNGQYCFPRESFLELRVKLNQINTAVAGSASYIDGSVYSLFSRMRVLHGSNVVEDLLYFNKLTNAIYDIQVSEVNRRGDCLTKLVSDTTSANAAGLGLGNQVYNNCDMGVQFYTSDVANTTGTDSGYFTACFVLPSALLGSLSQKALPLGLMGASSLYLELELAPSAIAFVTTNTTTSVPSYTVDQIYYNAKMTTLPSDVDSALIQSTGGIINLPAVAYKAEMKTIPSGSSAFNDKFSFQYSSMKMFLFFMQNNTTATASSSTGTGMISRSCTARTRANLSEFFLLINGESYPSQSISGTARTYSELLRCFDYLNDCHSNGGILSYSNYTQDSNVNTSDQLAATVTNTVQRRFIAGVNLDRFGAYTTDNLMAGTSSIGQMVSLQMNLSSPTSEVVALYAAVMYDVLFHIEGGLLQAKFKKKNIYKY